MVSKHFLKIFLSFIGMILLGLAGLFVTDQLDQKEQNGELPTASSSNNLNLP